MTLKTSNHLLNHKLDTAFLCIEMIEVTKELVETMHR